MTIDKQLQAYRMYQRFVRILLTIAGCWYMPTKSVKSVKYCWSIYVLLMLAMYLLIDLHLVYLNRHNLAEIMRYTGVAISTIGALLKVGTFLINRKSLINYHRMLNDLFEEELMQNEKIRAIMFLPISTTYILAYGYFAFMSSLILAYYAPSYIFLIHNLCHSRLTTNYTLPISRGYGYFWPVPDNFLYHFYFFFETSLVVFSGMTAVSVENVFGFYVYQFSSTMRAMTFKLMNPPRTENFSDLLRTCSAKHKKLLQCRITLEHIFGPLIFWHIVTNAMLLCSVLYSTVYVSKLNLSIIFAFLSYILVKLLQSFIYTWYGTVLTSASNDFRKGIYFGQWLKSSLDRQGGANVVIMLMQKPMTINAFYSTVDLTIFTNLVNATMSYFCLLQSISSKDE
ncbi:PREDICTED: uncharacterized protein LOC105460461 [Wasmannia auropunctata]|uniref:uncharacterized protein LOC105460461 n=1 Tax=Wasmannia auropunctata TaxID=64793 RepID=UPI0005EE1AB6|nr:PREDICTED: uncharacterized protein LOC105460461 [Wasmannia auropunctata]